MKVVIDTNVLVSAVFFGGIPGEIIGFWRDGLSRSFCDDTSPVCRIFELAIDYLNTEIFIAETRKKF